MGGTPIAGRFIIWELIQTDDFWGTNILGHQLIVIFGQSDWELDFVVLSLGPWYCIHTPRRIGAYYCRWGRQALWCKHLHFWDGHRFGSGDFLSTYVCVYIYMIIQLYSIHSKFYIDFVGLVSDDILWYPTLLSSFSNTYLPKDVSGVRTPNSYRMGMQRGGWWEGSSIGGQPPADSEP